MIPLEIADVFIKRNMHKVDFFSKNNRNYASRTAYASYF
jgi:ribonucleotide reductase beta subunit family protein with ferritin-like domain